MGRGPNTRATSKVLRGGCCRCVADSLPAKMVARHACRSRGGETRRLGCSVATSRAKPGCRRSSRECSTRALRSTWARVAGSASRGMLGRVEGSEVGAVPWGANRVATWRWGGGGGLDRWNRRSDGGGAAQRSRHTAPPQSQPSPNACEKITRASRSHVR